LPPAYHLHRYAHTAASALARVVIGAYGAAVSALLLVIWPYLLLLACQSAVGNPAILSSRAPWGFIPVGIDYFTHPHIDKDDATLTVVFLTLWKCVDRRKVGRRRGFVWRGGGISGREASREDGEAAGWRWRGRAGEAGGVCTRAKRGR
jgi:hypothetical protein